MSVAKSYAKALFEAAQDLGMKAADLDLIEKELIHFSSLVQSERSLAETMRNPVVSTKEKTAVADSISAKAGFSRLTAQFLNLISRKNRTTIFSDMAEAFTEVRLESEGAVLGTVISADPLARADLEDLAMSFTRKFGKKVVFKTEVDSALLAGLKVTVNGVTYDGSLRSQLQQLRDRLVRGT